MENLPCRVRVIIEIVTDEKRPFRLAYAEKQFAGILEKDIDKRLILLSAGQCWDYAIEQVRVLV